LELVFLGVGGGCGQNFSVLSVFSALCKELLEVWTDVNIEFKYRLRIKMHPGEECNMILEKYVALMEKLRSYITMLGTMEPISIAEISTKYQDKTGVYAFFIDRQ